MPYSMHHRAHDVGRAVEVVLRAGGDLVEHDLLGRAPAEEHVDAGLELLLRHQVAVVGRELLGVPSAPMPRGMIEILCTLSAPWRERRHQRVAALVHRHDLALLRR